MSVVANNNNAAIDPENQPEKQYNGSSNGSNGLQGGQRMDRTVTPGGHYANDDLIAIGSSHRKLANPLPMGAMSFATTTMILSLYNVQAQSVMVPNAVVTFALFYGGLVQYVAGIFEFITGNTLGATIFCSYGAFWWGYAMIFVPFFGEMGMYDSQPGVYSMRGIYAAEAENAIGLFLFVWLGITLVVTVGAARSSITLISLLVCLDVTFALLGAHFYTGSVNLQKAGGAMGIVTALIAYYLAMGSFFVASTSYFTLPLGSLAVKD